MDDSGGVEPYERIDQLHWSETELAHGKLIKIRSFPKDKKVKLFRVTVSTDRTEFVATNDITQDSTDAVQEVCNVRWKIEEFHREVKQLTGLEACQCRKARIQPASCFPPLHGGKVWRRNHIACALLVWNRLKQLAYYSGQTVYQLKQGLLSQYLISQLKSPTIPMVFA